MEIAPANSLLYELLARWWWKTTTRYWGRL